MFQKIVFCSLFQLFAKFQFILFRWRLGRKLRWGMFILKYFFLWRFWWWAIVNTLVPDDQSSSLSLSDSSEDELYFLFLDPLFFFLGDSFLLFFWPSLFFASSMLWHSYLKFYHVAGFLMESSQLELSRVHPP